MEANRSVSRHVGKGKDFLIQLIKDVAGVDIQVGSVSIFQSCGLKA